MADYTEHINIDASAYVKKTELPSNVIFYATSAASPTPGYNKIVSSILDADFDTPAVDIITPAISGPDIFIAQLISEPGVFIGNPGIINITTVGNVKRNTGGAAATFYFEVHHRDGFTSVETLLATSLSTATVSVDTYEQFSATALLNNGAWAETDQVVLKFYGTHVSGGVGATYAFQFGGAMPVRTTFPVPVDVLNNQFRWTIDGIEQLEGDIYLDIPCSIVSVENIVGTQDIVLQKNDASYILGDPIAVGDKITIIMDDYGVSVLNFLT